MNAAQTFSVVFHSAVVPQQQKSEWLMKTQFVRDTTLIQHKITTTKTKFHLNSHFSWEFRKAGKSHK